MASKLQSEAKRGLKRDLALSTGTFGEARKLQKQTRQLQERPFRKGASSRRRQAEKDIARQQQSEQANLAEAESEVALRRERASSRFGRRSLIKTSPTGLSSNLGGTNA